MTREIKGILPGPTGSILGERDFLKKFNLLSKDNSTVFGSENGLRALRDIAEQYRDAGATIGTSSTFCLTDLRLAGNASKEDWKPKKETLSLGKDFITWNRNAVSVARHVYGTNGLPIVGLVAPTTNTSQKSTEDQFYTALSPNEQIELSYQRQLPQIRVLAESGVDAIQVEACRFKNDAIGIVYAAKEVGISQVHLSFEVDKNGFPDPSVDDKYNFNDLRDELQERAGQSVKVLIGANCAGLSTMTRLFVNKEKIDILYPNQSDTGVGLGATAVKEIMEIANSPQLKERFSNSRGLSEGALKDLFTYLQDNKDIKPSLKEEILGRIYSEVASSPDQVSELWQRALETGTTIIGICCGGGPSYVEKASSLLHSLKTEEATL